MMDSSEKRCKNSGVQPTSSTKCQLVKRKSAKRKFEKLLGDEKNSSLNNNIYISSANVRSIERCRYCYQTQPDFVCFPPHAKQECIVLADEVLANIYTDKLDLVCHNLTNYSIYDKKGHMCAIDSGIMESNVPLYLTGYVKPIDENYSSIVKGVAAMELGPILEWWLSSYDGGSQALIGIATDYADYILIEPHPDYKKFMISVIEKIHLSKLVLENILYNYECNNPTYEDILHYVTNSLSPATGKQITEEDLIFHAQFILNQVLNYNANSTYHIPLANIRGIERLTQLSGAEQPINIPSRSLYRYRQQPRLSKTTNDNNEYSRATTTELVRDVLENNFAAQLGRDSEGTSNNNNTLTALNEFNDACRLVIDIDLNSTSVNVDNSNKLLKKNLSRHIFVSYKTHDSTKPLIGRVEFLFKSNSVDKVHLTEFMHSDQTVLGKTSDCQEIFILRKCSSIDLNNIMEIVDVVHKKPNNNWFDIGNYKLQDILEPVNRENKNNSFFYQLQYDDVYGRFEYPKIEYSQNIKNKVERKHYCYICESNKAEKKFQIPTRIEPLEVTNGIEYFNRFNLHRKTYKIGSFVYLSSDVFSGSRKFNYFDFKPIHNESNTNKTNTETKVDDTLYPEHYRKTHENTMCGSNETTPKPFEIGEILVIYSNLRDKMSNLTMSIRRMYRAEQIPMNDNTKNSNMNMLYWSDDIFRVPCRDVQGKCFVTCITNIHNPLTWSTAGPDRFYFTKQYDCTTDSLLSYHELPTEAKLTGKEVSVNYNSNFVVQAKMQVIPSYKQIKPLRGLDVFSGCGGMSKGLEDSGLVRIQWAIECDDKAAAAFELNHTNSTVFVENCNQLLKLAMSGHKTNGKNQKVPQKGEVDFICGSPPCQSFSDVNEFNSDEYLLFKNSPIVTFLSYIDFYRPKYFVMENVNSFVSYKKGMILKLTLRCITRMGYQCTFGTLQAGNFGVPQSSRRLIIMAAAPGEQLPLYPEPIHVFDKRESNLNVQVGEKMFRTNCKNKETAPMRTVTIYDAWSDLPEISNGALLEKIPYQSKPITHFQKLLRYPDKFFSESILTDHICKDMSPIVQARMELIPIGEGSDWRDLPNKEVKLSDGTLTSKLIYSYYDTKAGNSEGGAFRGVCHCASQVKCCPQDNQNNTIIPWCLSHTGSKHNNWEGLYGRISWSGFCSSSITNPEPMSKQGRVLHPEQHRVVSVRECARSQGFNDSFQFYGSIIDKHRQIGNAVPPPIGKAIGYEIIKAIFKNPDTSIVKVKTETR